MPHQDRLRLVVLSSVFPFPRRSGQQQRVYHTLKALREFFHITFLTAVPRGQERSIRQQLLDLCDDAILLPSRYARSSLHKSWHRLAGTLYCAASGLRRSNYVAGRVEFPPQRLATVLESQRFDCALFEYWHAAESTSAFHAQGVDCILDMHDILWQAYARHLQASALPPVWWKQWAVRQYRAAEQAAWSKFDALIAINAEEQTYARDLLADRVPVFYAPMGIDLEQWPYCWTPSDPPRIAYYGGLGNPHRQRDALHCYAALMPPIWRRFPAAQLWLVGSDPPAALFELARQEPRVRVTGFVEKVQEVLKTMTLLLCPWSGTYGFRSRLIEVLALGVPVVASAEAAYGMELSSGQGIFLAQSDAQLVQTCIDLLSDPDLLRSQSRLARNQVQEKFNFDATYGRLARDLSQFALARSARRVGLP